jgi:hypothetical protein
LTILSVWLITGWKQAELQPGNNNGKRRTFVWDAFSSVGRI